MMCSLFSSPYVRMSFFYDYPCSVWYLRPHYYFYYTRVPAFIESDIRVATLSSDLLLLSMTGLNI